MLSTLLTGGIPLVQALETAADSLGTPLLKQALEKAGKMVREGQPLSASLKRPGSFPPLSIDMIEVGESTGALPAMLNSVAEFYEDDVNTQDDRGAVADRARHHDLHGHFRGVCVDCAISADLLAGGHDSVEDCSYGDRSTRSDFRIRRRRPQQAQALAARYRCEYVDLREARIDHDLFRSIPVDLMFRYNFVPLQAQNGTLEIALADPRNLNLIDELALLLQQEAAGQGRDALADLRSAEEDRAVAARARRSHRRLHAGRGRRRRRITTRRSPSTS